VLCALLGELNGRYITAHVRKMIAKLKSLSRRVGRLFALKAHEEPRLDDSELNQLIQPEIKDDELSKLIEQLSATEVIDNVLEIGSSAGGGSTEAFVKGIAMNPRKPKLFCIEVSKPRFYALKERYRMFDYVYCYNLSSIAICEFPTPQAVSAFYKKYNSALRKYELSRVLGWLQQDIQYVRDSGVQADAIERIKAEHNISVFDMVLIDGSEFAGEVEFTKIYGAGVIILDDINSFKNYIVHHRLLCDFNYALVAENRTIRNGYSVFRHNDHALKCD
jgi:hypothetical protein